MTKRIPETPKRAWISPQLMVAPMAKDLKEAIENSDDPESTLRDYVRNKRTGR